MKIRPLPDALKELRRVARLEFVRALRRGVIVRADRCEECGRRQEPGVPRSRLGGIQAHHADYSKPLEVQWLCTWCHWPANVIVNQRVRAGEIV